MKYEKGITARWVGEPMKVPLRVPAKIARKAIEEGKPLEAIVGVPLAVKFREGKEFFRDAEGQAEGVIDATFADVGWDYAQMEHAAGRKVRGRRERLAPTALRLRGLRRGSR